MSLVKDENKWIIVGKFGRPHGLKGYISVYSFTEPRDNIVSYNNWAICIHSQWTFLKVTDIKDHTRFLTALIEGYTTREAVEWLTNLEIAVRACELPVVSSGEYYWHELIGMTVINTRGYLLGTISELIATGSNDVLVIMGKKRHLIPYRPNAVVLEVNEQTRQITVDWEDE